MKKVLDWSAYHDQGMGDAYADIPKHGGNYAKAISVCIRSDLCQKPDNRGVMCPSFRLRNDVVESPGGRVDLLKKLLNRDDDSFLKDPELAETMANCVSCKGCKRECENNLDMAAIKIEYLAQQRRAGHRSLRRWLFAEFPYLLHRWPQLGRLIRLRNRSRLIKFLGKKLLRVNASIPLPEPALKRYRDSAEQQRQNQKQASCDSVVLLIDSFTAQFQPDVAQDALKVLSGAGYHVISLHPDATATPLDSGRSLLSQGYTERARQQAQHLLSVLTPHLLQGRKIIGLEPSALLMLRDEYLMMNLASEVQMLAQQALLFEEFVAREKTAGRFNAEFVTYASPQAVLVHGHCHQKAVGAMKSMRKALRLIPELPFSFINASCCGMAGSFGLEAEHTEDSVAMAEQGLLPALDADPEALIVCNGFSCSHQIFALRQRQPVHLASLLARCLKSQ